jgi:ParB-like chromosome segregation protein Spo0J
MGLRVGAYKAKDRRQALEEAEKQLTVRPEGQKIIKLKPDDIGFRPALFQPREFYGGLKTTDGKTVKELADAIGIYGELDPVLVIKLGEQFVCVDGHHRLPAYKKEKWKKAIKCEWFGGSVREAVDESMRRNAKIKLNVPKADKLEEAWKRVVLRHGSKKEIAFLCGVSPRSVANMRVVVACANEASERGERLRRGLGDRSLDEVSWTSARMAWQGAERQTITEEEEAKMLAQRIGQKMEDRLSRNPAVTARALELYDADLPEALRRAWREQTFSYLDDEGADQFGDQFGDADDL